MHSMANYAFMKVAGLKHADAMKVLQTIVADLFDGKLVVREATFEDFYGPTWVVYAPETALPRPKCNRAMVAPDEDFGFTVSLQRGGFAFRRPLNPWASWAQGCVIEALSSHFNVVHVYDADDRDVQPGTTTNSCKRTFREWLMRNLDPNNPDDVAWVARYEDVTPKGFW